MRLCARGERSSGDALRLMQRWGVEEAERTKVLQKLRDSRFIDDSRFARAFVSDKLRLSGWGAHKIRAALRQKGVCTAIIEEQLRGLDTESTRDRLQKQLEKKARTVRHKDTYDLKTKLIRYGLSLGYDYEEVLDVVAALV